MFHTFVAAIMLGKLVIVVLMYGVCVFGGLQNRGVSFTNRRSSKLQDVSIDQSFWPQRPKESRCEYFK